MFLFRNSLLSLVAGSSDSSIDYYEKKKKILSLNQTLKQRKQINKNLMFAEWVTTYLRIIKKFEVRRLY